METGTNAHRHSMISVERLSRRFTRADGARVDALVDIDLAIEHGEFVCVIGPSGGGKTTLLSVIAGLIEPSGGCVYMDGRPIVGPGPDRGVVFQKDSVFPWMRVVDNVAYGLRCRGMARHDRDRIARGFLEEVGLSGVLKAWPRELSGGMLKRVAVATVFANGARVLLLDEPFGPLDYVTRRQLQEVLLRLWQQEDVEDAGRRRVVIFVTHDVDEALTLADRVVIVSGGRVTGDVKLGMPRPRGPEMLAQREVLDIKHYLLGSLGLENATPPVARVAAPIVRGVSET